MDMGTFGLSYNICWQSPVATLLYPLRVQNLSLMWFCVFVIDGPHAPQLKSEKTLKNNGRKSLRIDETVETYRKLLKNFFAMKNHHSV